MVYNIFNIFFMIVVKWQKNNEDINIMDSRYIGSINDLVVLKFVISKVEYNKDYG